MGPLGLSDRDRGIAHRADRCQRIDCGSLESSQKMARQNGMLGMAVGHS